MILLLACAAPRPDVLLVTLDTTRADAVGAYGASPSPTPALDALAAEGIVFDEALTVTPLTLPAHTSILTGLWPDRHGVRRNGVERLDASVDTLAERLRAGGYHTGAFVSAVVLDRAFGLDQGFDAYEGDFPGADTPSAVVPSHDADVATDAFVRWLLHTGARDDAPWFAWVHFYDAHLPNRAHDNGFSDPYLSEIRYADERLERVVAAARSMGRDRPLVVAVVGDHGEGRGDHGESTHGWYVYRSTTRVPMVLVVPGQSPRRESEPVSVVDLAPTLLRLAGLPDTGLDGSDLLGASDHVVYGETFVPRDSLGFAELRFAEDAHHRFILAPRPELYDWRADPGESHPIDGDAGPLRAFIERRTGAVSLRATTRGIADQLAALGYTDAPSSVSADTPFQDLPDPKDDPGAPAVVDAAIDSARRVPPAEGAPVLEATLARYPNAGALRSTLSRAYELLGRLEDAETVLGPREDPSVRLRAASLRLARGRLEEAEQLVSALDTDEAWLVRAEVRRRRGQPAEALTAAERGLVMNAHSAPLLLVAGAALTDMERYAEAIPLLRRSLTIDPGGTDARTLLAQALAETGDLDGARAALDEQRARFGTSGALDVATAKVEASRGDFAAAMRLLEAREADPALDWQGAVLLADLSARQGAPSEVIARRVALAERLGAPKEIVDGMR